MSRAPLALAVLVLLAWPSAPASAGTYDVWSCAGPNWTPAPIAGWKPVSNGAPPPANLCDTRQGLRAELQPTAVAAGGTAGWWFEAPPGTTIAAYELYRSARSGAYGGAGHRVYALYHDEPLFEPTVFLFEYCTQSLQGCNTVGDPGAPGVADPDNAVSRAGLRIRRLIVRMECYSAECPAADPPGALTIGRGRIALADDAAPVLSAASGPLLAPGAVLDGPQGVTASANDVGGGVQRFEVIVDGAAVGREEMVGRHPSCREPYVALTPCPPSESVSFAFDTATIPNGRHRIQIAAVDAAGNRTLSTAADVTIANGATPNGAGASRSARLSARFAGRGGRDRARVAFGRTRPVRGQLVDGQRRPIADARLEVIATPRQPGAQPKQEGVVTTNANGRFRYTPRRGPSRRLDFAYRAFSLDPEPSATEALALDVHAGVRLAVRPRRTTSRGTIRFHGRLLGGPGRAGVQVTLYAVGRQARSRVPVTVLHTGASGRFRFRYRFLRTFAPFTYRFLARVDRQRGYPYAPGESPVALVRVVR
jgi:hypothetical protein